MKPFLDNWKQWLLVSLTLGLAPFFPEPHVLGKLRWIAGGANGMQLMDWLDLAFHGTPWILLIRALIVQIMAKKKGESPSF